MNKNKIVIQAIEALSTSLTLDCSSREAMIKTTISVLMKNFGSPNSHQISEILKCIKEDIDNAFDRYKIANETIK